MKQVRVILLALLIGAAMPFAALAQKGNDNRPPKEPDKVKEREKPPPSNDNRRKPGD